MMADFPPPETDCEPSLFADDIEIHTTASSKRETKLRLQRYLNRIEHWAKLWKMAFSIPKCIVVSFTRKKNKDGELNLILNNGRIAEKDHFKFLGVIYDSKLAWDKHVDQINTSLIRRANCIKTVTYGKSTLQLKLLVRNYIAMIRTNIDYGSLILATIPKSKLNKLETTQNQILRSILGCFKSTPIPLIQVETGIPPIRERWNTLAARYLTNLSNKPGNPAYPTLYQLVNSQNNWKPRSIPAIITHLSNLEVETKRNLQQPTQEQYTDPLPPWLLAEINTNFFPLNKKVASKNHALTAAIFLETKRTDTQGHLSIYTDGSTCKTTRKSTRAVYIPETETKEAWLLSEFTNSFKTELAAIKQALSLTYNQDWNEITIYTDSKSAIQAICNYK